MKIYGLPVQPAELGVIGLCTVPATVHVQLIVPVAELGCGVNVTVPVFSTVPAAELNVNTIVPPVTAFEPYAPD